jgi:hypothetical protein
MANPPTSPKGTGSSPGANGKTGKTDGRSGPYDPKPGAVVKGKGRSNTAAVNTAGESQSRRAERRPDLIKKRREEMRRLPEKRQKEKLYVRIGLGAVAVLLVAAIAYGVYQWSQNRSLNQIPAGVVTYTDAVWTARNHDDAYNGWPDQDKHPPVGGTHSPTPQQCGFYDKSIGNGHAVHSLEHGAVWITYKPDLPQDQIDILKNLAKQDYILVSPYATQESPIVATSWDHQLQLQSASDKALEQFINVFKNSGKYTPEYGAACSGTHTSM